MTPLTQYERPLRRPANPSRTLELQPPTRPGGCCCRPFGRPSNGAKSLTIPLRLWTHARRRGPKWTLWTPEEVRSFIEYVTDHRLFAAFYLLSVTGLRRGKLLGLYWNDLQGSRLRIQRSYTIREGGPASSDTKITHGRHIVTLPLNALAVLAEHRERQATEVSAATEGKRT